MGSTAMDPRFAQALQDGLPVRIRIVVELWRDGLFDREEGRSEWLATLIQDPLTGVIRIRREGASPRLATVGSPIGIGDSVEALFETPLRPSRPGRFYYLASIEVETLSLTDLQELRRWLSGTLEPAIQGENGGIEGAVARGMGRFLQRALRLPTLTYRIRSPGFLSPPPRR